MKKSVYTFLIKKHLYMLDLKQETFSNCQATYQKELSLLFENQEILSQSERTDRLDPPSPCSFSFAF